MMKTLLSLHEVFPFVLFDIFLVMFMNYFLELIASFRVQVEILLLIFHFASFTKANAREDCH